jgi:alkylation response protein AidB-like acyl-CoA dehydrogenase
MFLVPINSPGMTLSRIKQVNGSVEFCEEFLDDVEVGDDAVIGEVSSLPSAAGSIIRISHAETQQLELDTALAITGGAGVVDGAEHLVSYGERYLSRQASALGGGTTEIARNIIGERVLGFPREYAADRGVPFNQVKRNTR